MGGEASSTENTGLVLGALVGGRYRLLRVVGEGGMGAVYEVETLDGERLALKALYASHDWNLSEQRVRFLREAGVTASLTHPNIVPVVDHGIDEPTTTPYLVMPFLAGEDLNTAIQRLGAIDPEVALRLFIQACLGLEAAHNAGVIHRDIKPSNLFLESGPGGTLTLRICDFGLAKAFVEADSLTNSGAFLGTPHYVSPEQATDAKRVDARSDVWSLAMTLYHALAGVPAYGHIDNVVGLIFELTAGRVRPLQEVAPWIDPRLARVVHGALLRDRDLRCPSVHEFAKALATILGDDGNATALTHSALRATPGDMRTRVAEHAELPPTWRDAVPAVEDGDEAHLLLGATLGGRYKLARVIGRGGMGAIYAAVTPDGAEVALKVMRPELARRSRDAMRRFVREARSAQAIHSDHVARVVEAGTDDKAGVPYIVMELLRGTDLGRLMKDKGPLEPKSILPVFVQACRGLSAAHALGIIHRDIKPANIFLHQAKAGEITTKLCDFGVAKQTFPGEIEDATTDLTRTGGMLGSPIYMSPEQAQNAKNVDHRTDVYSLGITLHQALSGQRPWQGCSTMGELILAICTREVVPLQEVAPWIDAALAQVVHRAVRRSSAERYQSAEEFAAALEPFASSAVGIRLDSLLPVSDAQRAISQPPAFASSLASSSSSDAGRSGTTRGGRSRWTRGRLTIGLLVLGGVLAGGAAVVASMISAQPPSPAIVNVKGTPAPPIVATHEPPVKVTVAISPASAKASVRGERRELVDGVLPLEGKPGERFLVLLEQDGVHKEFFVAITSDATAVPSALELPAAQPPAAPTHDAGTAPVASSKPSFTGRGLVPLIPKSGVATTPDPAPPTSASAALPELKTKW